MAYSWILVDADGTLFDYDLAEAAALRESLADVEVECTSEVIGTYRTINTSVWRAFERGEITQAELRTKRFEDLFESLNVRRDAAEFSRLYLDRLSRQAQLIGDAESVIRTLRTEARLVLLTNGLAEVQRPRLARSALRGLFDAVVISEEVGAAKPDRRIFDICFEHMGRPRREEVLMVGDSLTSDIRGGIEYGIDTCWFNPAHVINESELHPRYEIAALSELVPILMGSR